MGGRKTICGTGSNMYPPSGRRRIASYYCSRGVRAMEKDAGLAIAEEVWWNGKEYVAVVPCVGSLFRGAARREREDLMGRVFHTSVGRSFFARKSMLNDWSGFPGGYRRGCFTPSQGWGAARGEGGRITLQRLRSSADPCLWARRARRTHHRVYVPPGLVVQEGVSARCFGTAA